MSREDNERVVVHLIMEGILKESFSHTAYATNSYIISNPAITPLLKAGQLSVQIPFRVSLADTDADVDATHDSAKSDNKSATPNKTDKRSRSSSSSSSSLSLTSDTDTDEPSNIGTGDRAG